MIFRLICTFALMLSIGCGGSAGTSAANQGQGGNTGSGTGTGSGGEAGMMAMQGGGTLPADVAQCEEGCLQARQCDLDACYSDVSGRLITDCSAACQGPNLNALAALAGGACPDTGLQARELLGIGNQCLGETSRCPRTFCEDGSACADGTCADGRNCASCPSEQECVDGACGVFACVTDNADNSGNDAFSAEPAPNGDGSVQGRTLCTGDEDWFSFTLPANQNLFIDVVFVHGIGDVDVEVFDALMPDSRAFNSLSATDNEQLVIPANNAPRDFLLRVFTYGEAENKYDLYFNYDVPLAVCTSGSQCGAGETCTNNACTPLPPCQTNDDCSFGASICDVASGICYECLTNEDCGDGVCSENSCVDCLSDADCMAGVCVESSCVECVTDNDCAAGEICLGSSCGSLACRDSLEPNDTEESAVVINPGMQYDGLYICGDEDFYRFTVPQGQPFIFNLTFIDAEGDIDVSITQGGERVGSGVTTSDNEEVVFPASIAGGEYVAKVKRFGSTSGTCVDGFCAENNQACEANSDCPPPASEQIYGMFVDTNPPAGICNTTEDCVGGEECDNTTKRCRPEGYCSRNQDCAEEDGSQQCDVASNSCVPCRPSEAMTTLEAPATVDAGGYRGNHNTCGGSDFFGINLNAGQVLRVEVSFVHENGDIDMKLLDSAGMQLTSSAGTADIEEFEYTAEVSGLHILEVYGFRGVFNEYRLQLNAQ